MERPKAPTSRRVLDELDRLGLPYERIPIDPEHADTAVFCERHGYPLSHSGHTPIVSSRQEPRSREPPDAALRKGAGALRRARRARRRAPGRQPRRAAVDGSIATVLRYGRGDT